MLSQIQFPKKNIESHDAASGAAPDTIELLLGCHQRIRHFSGVGVRLANAQGVAAPEIVQAAEGLIRYFSIALPLHAQDEDESIHPRLLRFLPEGELARPASDTMVEQHQEIDRILEALLPLWTILQAAPARLYELAPELRGLSARLDDLFRDHLEMEEQTIFPAMRAYVPATELEAIAQEMKARRK
ncbi:MAG TPA: hemerythrin domain-containing protein [Clostridia bacterium]|nr:hemerythrin domain-containing protein [Clostridia bacterium]